MSIKISRSSVLSDISTPSWKGHPDPQKSQKSPRSGSEKPDRVS